MMNFERLALYNLDTADRIVSHQSEFLAVPAEILVRNTWKLAKMLEAEDFFDLPQYAEERALEAADAAHSIAPINHNNLHPDPEESDLAFHYRTGVWMPIESLGNKIATASYVKDDSETNDKLRKATKLSSSAFAAILLACEDHPEVRSAERYFWSNSMAAAGRVAQKLREG